MPRAHKALIVAVGIVTAIMLLPLFLGVATVLAPPCDSDAPETVYCYWDAKTQGNNHGDSFLKIGGFYYTF